MVILDLKVRKDRRDLRGQPVQLVQQVLKVPLVILDLKARRVQLVQLGLQVRPVLKVQLVHRVL